MKKEIHKIKAYFASFFEMTSMGLSLVVVGDEALSALAESEFFKFFLDLRRSAMISIIKKKRSSRTVRIENNRSNSTFLFSS